MNRAKKRKPVRLIAIQVTKSELEQIELIMKKRRINTYAHTLRVLIAEEVEKFLNSATISSVANECSTQA